jgi:uncharacterized protein
MTAPRDKVPLNNVPPNTIPFNIIRTRNSGTINIVVKVSKRCNIDPPCTYCYDTAARSGDTALDMSMATLERLVQSSVGDTAFDKVTFVWHGGEPLIVGKSFYENALAFQKRHGDGIVRVVNRIQTNAVAMDSSWVEFLKANDFKMETSFDAFDNDQTRGSTQRVLANIMQAKELGYAPGNVMFICTSRNVDKLREAYDYFERLGLDFNPSPIITLGKACQAPHLSITPERYGQALADLLDYYVLEHPKRTTRVRILDAVLGAILTGNQNLCSHGYCAYEFIAVDHKGDIYPCAKVNDPAWSFGNVHEIARFSDVLYSKRYQEYTLESTQRVKRCMQDNDGKPCTVLAYCRGGCASNALSAGGYSKQDFYCQTYKIIFTHAIDLLINMHNEKLQRVSQ